MSWPVLTNERADQLAGLCSMSAPDPMSWLFPGTCSRSWNGSWPTHSHRCGAAPVAWSPAL